MREIATVTAAEIHLRSTPDERSRLVDVMERGDQLEIYERSEDEAWLHGRVSKIVRGSGVRVGKLGWVKKTDSLVLTIEGEMRPPQRRVSMALVVALLGVILVLLFSCHVRAADDLEGIIKQWLLRTPSRTPRPPLPPQRPQETETETVAAPPAASEPRGDVPQAPPPRTPQASAPAQSPGQLRPPPRTRKPQEEPRPLRTRQQASFSAPTTITCAEARQGVGMPCFLIVQNSWRYARLSVADKRKAQSCLSSSERAAIASCFRSAQPQRYQQRR